MTTKSELGKKYSINVDSPLGGDWYNDVSDWRIDESTGRLEFTAHSTYSNNPEDYTIITTKPYIVQEDLWARRKSAV